MFPLLLRLSFEFNVQQAKHDPLEVFKTEEINITNYYIGDKRDQKPREQWANSIQATTGI